MKFAVCKRKKGILHEFLQDKTVISGLNSKMKFVKTLQDKVVTLTLMTASLSLVRMKEPALIW